MPKNSVDLGWGADPIGVQHPILDPGLAAALDRDNQEVSRLRVRGLIADSEMRRIRRRLVRSIETAIKKALAEKEGA